MAEVIEVLGHSTGDKSVIVEFYDGKRHLFQKQINKRSEFYVLPKVGDKIVVKYVYNNQGQGIDYIDAQFKGKYRPTDWVFLFFSIFILVFSVGVESRIRK